MPGRVRADRIAPGDIAVIYRHPTPRHAIAPVRKTKNRANYAKMLFCIIARKALPAEGSGKNIVNYATELAPGAAPRPVLQRIARHRRASLRPGMLAGATLSGHPPARLSAVGIPADCLTDDTARVPLANDAALYNHVNAADDEAFGLFSSPMRASAASSSCAGRRSPHPTSIRR